MSRFKTLKPVYDLFKLFEGNWAANKPATHLFHEAALAQYVRIRPVQWVKSISLRLELLGSLGKTNCFEGHGKILRPKVTLNSYSNGSEEACIYMVPLVDHLSPTLVKKQKQTQNVLL